MGSRLHRLRAELSALNLDALLITDILNVRYISGFTGSYALLLISQKESLLLTDSRYTEQAIGECTGFSYEPTGLEWVGTIAETVCRIGARRIGFEAKSVHYQDWNSLRATLSPGELIPTEDIIPRLRMVKDESEVQAIRQAVRITDDAWTHVSGLIKPGMREVDVALEIDFFMRRLGADKEGFDTIVASGPRSALPHGKPTDRVISAGELITMDFGAKWHGYHGDITRTIVLSSPDDRQVEIYNIVLEAQQKAIDAIKPGISGGEIDAIARDYIADKGYGEYFGHGLGHGLGLAIHDSRLLARNSDVLLQPGMVATVEPGIYIPGWGGVRIEEDILVTDSGCEVLTHSPRTLILD